MARFLPLGDQIFSSSLLCLRSKFSLKTDPGSTIHWSVSLTQVTQQAQQAGPPSLGKAAENVPPVLVLVDRSGFRFSKEREREMDSTTSSFDVFTSTFCHSSRLLFFRLFSCVLLQLAFRQCAVIRAQRECARYRVLSWGRNLVSVGCSLQSNISEHVVSRLAPFHMAADPLSSPLHLRGETKTNCPWQSSTLKTIFHFCPYVFWFYLTM